MMWSRAYYLEVTLRLFLRSYSPLCVMRRPSTLENKYSSIFFYKTIAPTVLKFYMEHDLAPGSQNYEIGSGRIRKMAAVTKNNKNNKINFFSRTTGYFWLNFSWNINGT